MLTEVKVVDASAVAALLFGEPAAEDILQQLGEAALVAPTLLRYEVGSVCLKKLVRYGDQSEALLEALALLDRMEIEEIDIPIADATILAVASHLTLYDAAYLWLATSLDAELITLNRRLRSAWISACESL